MDRTQPGRTSLATAVPRPQIHPPTPDQVAHLVEVASGYDPTLAVFVLLAAVTGARRGELLALRWTDIDLDTGVVDVARGVVIGRDGPVEKDTKTHTTRRVSVDATTVTSLTAHRERVTATAAALGTDIGATAYVFSHEADASRPIRPDVLTHSFVRLRARAGLPKVRLHDLRHFVATRLLSSGADVRTVAGRLGHRDAATTLNVYSHFLAEADRQAAAVIAEMIGAADRPCTADPPAGAKCP